MSWVGKKRAHHDPSTSHAFTTIFLTTIGTTRSDDMPAYIQEVQNSYILLRITPWVLSPRHRWWAHLNHRPQKLNRLEAHRKSNLIGRIFRDTRPLKQQLRGCLSSWTSYLRQHEKSESEVGTLNPSNISHSQEQCWNRQTCQVF